MRKCKIIDADQKQPFKAATATNPGPTPCCIQSQNRKSWSTFKRASSPHLFSWPWFFCVFCCVVVARVCSAARDRHQTSGAVTKSLAVISSFSPFVSALGFGHRSLSLRPCFTLLPRGSPLREARLPALCQRRKLALPPHNRPEVLFLSF